MNQTLGAVSYFNTVPLVYGLERLLPEYRLVFDLPSRLCDRLASLELDAALIPVVETLGRPEWKIVSDACIACRGPVWSVKLLSRVPLHRIDSLALDEGSRTSIALVRILLAEQFGTAPHCLRLPIDEDYRAVTSDAVLVIGDRAMQPATDQFPHVLDLGEAWKDWTGLPFVFAVWAANSDADDDRLDTALATARDWGVSQAPQLARQHCGSYGLTESQAERYLTAHLHFALGPAERQGLSLFLKKVAEHGLHASETGPIKWETVVTS